MRHRAIMTVQLEDYRHHARERLTGVCADYHPDEVARQTDRLLDGFARLDIGATFFAVGELGKRLPPGTWRRITERHRVGCHGHIHRHVGRAGREGFREDVRSGKAVLEDVAGVAVDSYRAPDFSADGTDPWFGEELAEAGYRLDSSRRIAFMRTPGGVTTLPGAGDAFAEVPLMSVGMRGRRVTVIGGTTLRALPLRVIVALMERARVGGFAPMVYLHPYDLDPQADPLRFSGVPWRARVSDVMRRYGRDSVWAKIEALSRRYAFAPVETLLV